MCKVTHRVIDRSTALHMKLSRQWGKSLIWVLKCLRLPPAPWLACCRPRWPSWWGWSPWSGSSRTTWRWGGSRASCSQCSATRLILGGRLKASIKQDVCFCQVHDRSVKVQLPKRKVYSTANQWPNPIRNKRIPGILGEPFLFHKISWINFLLRSGQWQIMFVTNIIISQVLKATKKL